MEAYHFLLNHEEVDILSNLDSGYIMHNPFACPNWTATIHLSID